MRNESSSQIRHHTIPNVGAVISEALSPKSRKPERAMSPRKSTGSAPTCWIYPLHLATLLAMAAILVFVPIFSHVHFCPN
jgi:hypothetical protein